ncbi:MAG: heavy-metal-associated domain-containing protein [Thermoleophilaceae bacterium]
MTRAKLKVDGMHCGSCALSVDDRLEEIAGVEKSATSFRRGQAKVHFDERRITVEALVEAVSELGYHAEPA